MDEEKKTGVQKLVDQLVQLNKRPCIILKYLERDLGIRWSARTLRRFCQVNNIRRYDDKLLPRDVVDAISAEALGSAQRLGYRRMWERLRRKNIRATRDQVATCMKLLGLEKEMPYNKKHKKQHHIYTSKGPNYLWHIDGFDKLNRWGFYVHSAIDGYSRKILWLRVFVTNKDPWLVGKYYMAYIRESTGQGLILAQKIQFWHSVKMFLRRDGEDEFGGPNSHYTGSSEINQPIEAFWRIFREGGSQFWIDHFKNLEEDANWIQGSAIHQLCLLFVYMPLLQRELVDIKNDWNQHKIRLQKKTDRPNGVPDELYDFPEEKGGLQMGKSYKTEDYEFLMDKFDFDEELEYLPYSFRTEAQYVCDTHALPLTIECAKDTFNSLVEYFLSHV